MLCAKNELSMILCHKSNCIERREKIKGTFWFAECLPEKWSEIRQPTFILYIGVMSIYSSLTMWIDTRSNINQRYCFNLLTFVTVWKFPRVFIGENRLPPMPPPEAETDNGWPATSIFFVLSVSLSEHWMSHPEAGMGKTQKTESSNGQCGLRTQVNGENTFDRNFASKNVDIIFTRFSVSRRSV